MIRRRRWLLASLLPLATLPLLAQPAAAPEDVTFRIFVRGQPVGAETVTVVTLPDSWKVMSTGQIAAPISLTTRLAEVVYHRDWRPQSLFIDGLIKGQATSVKTTFSGTTAVSDIVQDEKSFQKTDTVAERTVVLPNLVFGTYEALAARLSAAPAGETFRIYVAPQGEIDLTLDAVASERVSAPGRTFEARRHALTFQNPGGPLKMDLWTDGPRLMRLTIPSVSLDVIRDDVASVATRTTTEYRPNDEDVRVAGNGFNLAGTLSKPADAPAASSPEARRNPLPAVVLVAGSGPLDRDETVAGVPIFAQLAAALADAGFAVVRYDKRGIGQSGGRAESATLHDYAEDVVAVVKFLDRRRDIDRKRIAVVGHSEGAAVSLLAARREKKIGALVLIAGPGTSGAELVLEQQRQALERRKMPEADKAAKIELQKKVHAAVLSGAGWEEIPEDLRRQADSPWFRSFLDFDPAEVVPRVKRPIFIVQGALDSQVPPHHAEKLAALANGRKDQPPAEVVILPGVNHLLVQAKTGEVDEYGSLESREIVPGVAAKIADWLRNTLAKRS